MEKQPIIVRFHLVCNVIFLDLLYYYIRIKADIFRFELILLWIETKHNPFVLSSLIQKPKMQ